MQELNVYDVEQGALLVANDAGERFRIVVSDAVIAQLRGQRSRGGAAPKVAPREIQAHIRAGLSADEVVTLTGASLETVQRFEGPVLAEREHMLEQALNVAAELPDGTADRFGAVVRARLAESDSAQERWVAWRDAERGWVVKLTFVAGGVGRDARWEFEPRARVLTPINADATTLSHRESHAAGLIPRLRAVPFVDPAPSAAAAPEERFDSGAFVVETDAADAASVLSRAGAAASAEPLAETSDLLEALRRRRGERAEMPSGESSATAAHPSTGSIRLVDVPFDGFEFDAGDEDAVDEYRVPTAELPVTADGARAQNKPSSRRGRSAMPSWDEIVFGARTDED